MPGTKNITNTNSLKSHTISKSTGTIIIHFIREETKVDRG